MNRFILCISSSLILLSAHGQADPAALPSTETQLDLLPPRITLAPLAPMPPAPDQAKEQSATVMDLPQARLTLPLALDLPTAKHLAIQNNPQLKEAYARLEQQEGVLDEARSGRRPKLDLGSSYSLQDDNRLQDFGDFTPDQASWNAGAETSITVFSNGRNKRQIQGARHLNEAERSNLSAVQRELLARVQETYLDAQLATETLAVQEESIDVLKEQLAYVSNRHKAGVGAPFDVKQAEVALANAQPALIRADNTYRRNIDQLRRLLGLPFARGSNAREIELKPLSVESGIGIDLQQALASGIEIRPEIIALQAQIKAQQTRVEIEERGTSPLIDLFAGYGIENDQFGGDENLHGWRTGVRLNWRFADGGASRGRVRQQEAVLRQMVFQAEALKLDVEGEVRSAWFDFEEAESILVSTKFAIEEAAEALTLSQNRFKAGQGTQLELLESQLQLYKARLNQTNARNALHRSIIEIRIASGLPLD